jgi:hypothetical protein
MDEPSTTDRIELPVELLRWRTGALGCLLPLVVAATLLFAIAAIRPTLAADLADERRGALIGLTSGISVAGVNVPLALLALYLAWETFRFGWRWADQIAMAATDRELLPHASLFMKPISFSEVQDVRFITIGRAPSLLVVLRTGGSRTIRGVDNQEGAAERFAAAVRERLSPPKPT